MLGAYRCEAEMGRQSDLAAGFLPHASFPRKGLNVLKLTKTPIR
jgi:hypothetical protein